MTAGLAGSRQPRSFASYERLEDTVDTFAAIRDLGLQAYAAELDEYGYTVLPPEKVAPPDFVDEVRDAVLEAAAEGFGIPRAEVGPRSTDAHRSFFAHQMLGRGAVFERVLMNPASLALVTHLLGESCVLSSMGAFLKGPSDKTLDLHTDNVAIPAPFPSYSQVANSTYLLSDYSTEHGSITVAPRSHKLGRHPLPSEVGDVRLGVPVDAPAGSLIVFHGNTWHCACARRTPGYRITLISYFVRMYLLRQEDPGYVTDEMRERKPAAFPPARWGRHPVPVQRRDTRPHVRRERGRQVPAHVDGQMCGRGRCRRRDRRLARDRACGLPRGCAARVRRLVCCGSDLAAAEAVTDEVREAGRRAAVHLADLADVEALDALARAARDLGPVTLLVNNAGRTHSSSLAQMSYDGWQHSLALNLTAPVWLSRLLAPDLATHRGAIINVGSTGGIVGSVHSLPYAATRAGLLGVTKTLARMLAPDVRVNLVAPGITDTDLLAGITDAQREEIVSGQPLRRIGTAEEAARAVMDVAGWTYATGQTVVVDGGRVM